MIKNSVAYHLKDAGLPYTQTLQLRPLLPNRIFRYDNNQNTVTYHQLYIQDFFRRSSHIQSYIIHAAQMFNEKNISEAIEKYFYLKYQ